MLNIGMPDSFIPHGKVDILLERFGMDSNGIALRISAFLGGFKKKHYVGI